MPIIGTCTYKPKKGAVVVWTEVLNPTPDIMMELSRLYGKQVSIIEPMSPTRPATAPEALSADDEVQATGRAVILAVHAHERALARKLAEQEGEPVFVPAPHDKNATIIQAAAEPDLPGINAAEQAEAAFGNTEAPNEN